MLSEEKKNDIRERAAEIIKKSSDRDPTSSDRVLYEPRAHQIELELQNEELQDRQKEKISAQSSSDESYSKKYQGIGLGLSLAKSMTELLSGNIGFESEYGKGTEFILEASNGKEAISILKDTKEFLKKPFEKDDILSVIQKFLGESDEE